MIKYLRQMFTEKYFIRLRLLVHFSPLFPDKWYLEKKFLYTMGYKLDLDNPQTFNEKLQWLKLYDRRAEYTKMVDKYEAKKYVASKIGEQYIIPTLGVYESPEDIDFSVLPNQFVLKCTQDSGSLIICRDKSKLDIKKVCHKLKKGLKRRYFYWGREWPYKDVHPRIIAEQYMEDTRTKELCDYKWFCFNGEPKFMFIATDRFNNNEDTKFDFFDMNFNHIPVTNGHPNATSAIAKPQTFDVMKSLAAKLSKGIPHVRVDFYEVDGKVFWGELTFSHWSGMVPFEPKEWDYVFGKEIKLPTFRASHNL